MPYLTQPGVIIHGATQAIEFADDVRIPPTTIPNGLDIQQVATMCPTNYHCAVRTTRSLVLQPSIIHVTLHKNVTIPGCTAQIIETSIPGKLYVDGYDEPGEDVGRGFGVLTARVYIPSITPIGRNIRLWIFTIHDTARKVLAGQIAHIQSYDSDVVSDVYSEHTWLL